MEFKIGQKYKLDGEWFTIEGIYKDSIYVRFDNKGMTDYYLSKDDGTTAFFAEDIEKRLCQE